MQHLTAGYRKMLLREQEKQMAVYPNTGKFGVDLNHDCREGWCGTYARLVRAAATDILSDGEPYGPVEVSYTDDDGTTSVAAGVLVGADDNTIEIQQESGSQVIDVDAVMRFRI